MLSYPTPWRNSFSASGMTNAPPTTWAAPVKKLLKARCLLRNIRGPQYNPIVGFEFHECATGGNSYLKRALLYFGTLLLGELNHRERKRTRCARLICGEVNVPNFIPKSLETSVLVASLSGALWWLEVATDSSAGREDHREQIGLVVEAANWRYIKADLI